MGQFDIIFLLGVPAAIGAFLFLTPQGKDILAQIQGMVSFDTYDPQKTDLFPEGKEPATLRKEIPNLLEKLGKEMKTEGFRNPTPGLEKYFK
jgi:hypothetical protein